MYTFSDSECKYGTNRISAVKYKIGNIKTAKTAVKCRNSFVKVIQSKFLILLYFTFCKLDEFLNVVHYLALKASKKKIFSSKKVTPAGLILGDVSPVFWTTQPS